MMDGLHQGKSFIREAFILRELMGIVSACLINMLIGKRQ
jgi:hypothetical protein